VKIVTCEVCVVELRSVSLNLAPITSYVKWKERVNKDLVSSRLC